MDNQHKKITGYRDLSQAEIDMMNEGKALAVQCGAWIERLQSYVPVDPDGHQEPDQKPGATLDQRSVALGKTNLQQGFMWAIRGIAQPSTF